MWILLSMAGIAYLGSTRWFRKALGPVESWAIFVLVFLATGVLLKTGHLG